MPSQIVNNRVAIVSTYPPRRCGLATYTSDLRGALNASAPDLDVSIVAIDRDKISHGPEVKVIIDQDDDASYTAAADALADLHVGVVLIQHEYGIFGGRNGSYVLHLARQLTARDIPYMVTLHTVLTHPSEGQYDTLRMLCQHAARVTVFTQMARHAAADSGLARPEQLVVVPHGAPLELVATVDPPGLRSDLAELDGRVLTTFGLISPGKGLETAIEAFAKVVTNHPDLRYVIAGQTHPEVVRHSGESYRDSLVELTAQLGLGDRVRLVDAFLTTGEIGALMRRTTIFVTPYRGSEQTCSGALTFALAGGCPVVSTRYQYAEAMLSGGAGIIVPIDDPAALAAGMDELLSDPDRMARAKAAAVGVGSRLTWPAVALRAAAELREVANPFPNLPPLCLDHLGLLTDELGIVQFSRGGTPDADSGYCVDDVARLGAVAADLYAVGQAESLALEWMATALRFIGAANQGQAGLHNMMSYHGAWLDDPHLADHVGRAIWGVGAVAGAPNLPAILRVRAEGLLDELCELVPALAELHPRTVAYTLLGLAQHPQTHRDAIQRLAETLEERWNTEASDDWYWPEDGLTYDNARLIQAALAGAAEVGRPTLAKHALMSLDWYVDQVGLDCGQLRCIGNKWRFRGGTPEPYEGDEQPLDAAATVEALVEAWRYTGARRYADLARRAFGWFLGNNRLGESLYEAQTGAGHDGLRENVLNVNRGAESTLAYFQAMLALVRHGLADLPGEDRGGAGHTVRDTKRVRRSVRVRRRGNADARRVAE